MNPILHPDLTGALIGEVRAAIVAAGEVQGVRRIEKIPARTPVFIVLEHPGRI
jgi:hypothetical protein